jgi:hypothetical protein
MLSPTWRQKAPQLALTLGTRDPLGAGVLLAPTKLLDFQDAGPPKASTLPLKNGTSARPRQLFSQATLVARSCEGALWLLSEKLPRC